ncbi:Pth11-like integral membrane protein [Cladophialophora carrionii]|uniref:Pth11-like integral membrane protein n=1 Tax=Cladophialophora carrionii TaxID=86049 RepID=A0A1C1CYG4_9EURO|nr:Pth11-like integral membrane protein [Cladophialophora carrionii]
MLVSSEGAKVGGWVCAGLSLVIVIVRIFAARLHHGSFDVSTVVCVAAIVTIIARLVVNQFVLTYGTSNDALNGKSAYFNAEDLEDLKIGSVLSLIARLLITTICWLQNCLLLLFYSRIFEIRARWTTKLIRTTWIAIPVTYIIVILSTFLECHPFHLYWQVDPSPGKCVKAYVQLLVQGISNIVLDLLLLAISYPLLAAVRHRTLSEQLRIGTLCCLGVFCIIITIVRIAYIYAESSYQPVRSFFASVQIAASCFVANVPTIYGCIRMIRRRKSEQMTRRASRPEIWLHLQATNESRVPVNVPVTMTRDTITSSNAYEKAWARWVP